MSCNGERIFKFIEDYRASQIKPVEETLRKLEDRMKMFRRVHKNVRLTREREDVEIRILAHFADGRYNWTPYQEPWQLFISEISETDDAARILSAAGHSYLIHNLKQRFVLRQITETEYDQITRSIHPAMIAEQFGGE